MSTPIYSSLNFPASMNNNVVEFDANTEKHMNAIPSLVSRWQYEDVANNDTGGYYVNPVANLCNTIITIASKIYSKTTIANVYLDLPTINSYAYLLANTSNNFYYHTNRLSGVDKPSGDTGALPHLNSAINTGRILTYFLYQYEDISNNSVILGNFSSLYTANDLIVYVNTISNYPNVVNNSIYSETFPDLGYRSNLSSTIKTQIASDFNNIINFMANTETSDVNFFNNSQKVVSDFNDVKGMNSMGATYNQLVNEVIGTDKLKSRLNQ
jgi:hypothetical protein